MLPGAKGIAARVKDATRSSWPYTARSKDATRSKELATRIKDATRSSWPYY